MANKERELYEDSRGQIRKQDGSMNLTDIPLQTLPHSIEAEQCVLGALMQDNEAIYRIPELRSEHFYDYENAKVFAEISRQIAAGSRCDVLTVFDVLKDKIADCLPYLNGLVSNTPSSANITRYAGILVDRAVKRSLIALGGEMQGTAHSPEDSTVLIDRAASELEKLAQKKVKQDPMIIADMLSSYVDMLQDRIDGKIKSISTGFDDLDTRLDGGLERGTLTVIAARPAMGKTAIALALARNVGEWGTSLFLSMEMSKDQINDRNIAALGRVPVSWLRKPTEEKRDKDKWDNVTHAFHLATKMNMFIDDQTALTMLEIRAKARSVKRKNGLDLLVIDQLSFITGSDAENKAYELGEYTRGLMNLSKELNCAVVLLAQLNRECEKRNNKRPMLSDLASSGSIEQDAANVMFLYRDEVYNPDTRDKGICEVITTKQRQGEPGTVALSYIGSQTRFENLAYQWKPQEQREVTKSKGFD